MYRKFYKRFISTNIQTKWATLQCISVVCQQFVLVKSRILAGNFNKDMSKLTTVIGSPTRFVCDSLFGGG